MEEAADESSVEQDVTPPPANLTATVISSTRIDLSWSSVPNATKYYVFMGNAPGTETFLATSFTTSYSNNHLTPGTQYCWQVEAEAFNQASAKSNEVCVTTIGLPNAPTNVVATPVSTSRVNVTWDAVSGAQKYYTYRSDNGGAYALIATALTNSYTDANLSPATSYCYEIRVVTSSGTSNFSQPGCTSTFTGGLEAWWKLNERTGTTAIDSSGLGNHGTLQGSVTYSTTDKPPVADDFSTLQINTGTSSLVTVPSQPPLNLGGGNFTVALWVKLNAAPTGPVYIIGKRAGGCGASTWQLVQDPTNGLHFDGAALSARFGRSLPVGVWTHVAVSKSGGDGNEARLYINGAQVALVGYTRGSDSTAAVQIGNSGSCGSSVSFLVDDVRLYSVGLTAAQIADLGTVPPPPANLTATVMASYRVDLSWNAVTNAQKYFVWRGTASGNEQFVTTVAAPTTTYSDTHLTANTQYSYFVTDQAHGLLSGDSNEVIVTTQPLPSAPTVTATAASSTKVNVSWTSVTGAVKYYVYQQTGGTGSFVFKSTVIAPTTTYAATGLTTGTQYCYEVRVVTANGTSDYSAPACATTP
jgi:fibronectin type 3 domain-containing protein